MNKLNNHSDLGDVLIRSDLNVPMINNEITDLEAATYSMLSKFKEFEDSNISLNTRKNDTIRTYQKNELDLIIKILLENYPYLITPS